MNEKGARSFIIGYLVITTSLCGCLKCVKINYLLKGYETDDV